MAGVVDWRGWLIDDTQADLIRRGDIPARNRFFFDNYKRVRGMAYNYTRKNPRCYGLARDMINNLYVDLGYFKSDNGVPVTDGLSLSRFVVSSFRMCPYGGLLYLSENNAKLLAGGCLKVYAPESLSLDKPFGSMHGAKRHQDDSNACVLGDIVPAPDCFESLGAVDLTDDIKGALADLFPPRLGECFALFMDGYADKAIADQMGRGARSTSDLGKVRDKLRKNSAFVLARLSALGVDIEPYKDKTPYNPKTERTYKLSPEKRAYYRENMRKQRARKRALMTN